MSSLQDAFQIIRDETNNEVEKGTAFERLAKVFFEKDKLQTQLYSKVWHYKDWAKERPEYLANDIGIDLVAKHRDEEGYCAIQCKFYQSDHAISKADMDSFISASATPDFTKLVLIDTSNQPLGKNAQSVFDNLTKGYARIQSSSLEQSLIDWLALIRDGEARERPKKKPHEHQIHALAAVKEGLEEEDRGKMIMACGTGKTYTSLLIAEELAGPGKTVLYMVPSLSLMSQTIREWKNDATEEFMAFSVCSDIKVGKRKSEDDQIDLSPNDLEIPATTDASKLAEKINKQTDATVIAPKMTVVFSTYHSIDVISRSQSEFGLGEFALIICDEAHRTTGATFSGDDESNFVKIHDNDHVRAKKRLYMTATTRIYGETAKKQAEEGDATLASMDDEETFGKLLFHRGFGWAVENNMLTDYKVVILAMDEQEVSNRIQKSFTTGSELELEDAVKMVGCYKALAKVGGSSSEDTFSGDKKPMKRALAFLQKIKYSKIFSEEFSDVVKDYTANEGVAEEQKSDLDVEIHHVDGTFNAEERNEKLNWLKDEESENKCRVLSNVRCLSEGVDVPDLDAIMFLHPRKSEIDVVQAVGRVMRKAEGKKLGYVILPIAVAPGVSPDKALDDNDKYKVVWQILNALRAHDERLDSTINRIGLGEDVSDRIEIINGSSSTELEATTAVVDEIKEKTERKNTAADDGKNIDEEDEETKEPGEEKTQGKGGQLSINFTELSQAIRAKIVKKCGTREYWETWAHDIAKISQTHITRINSIVLNSGTPEREAFMRFVTEIRDDLNPGITENDAVEMLAQHIITRPVFDTLFKDNKFSKENAVSKAMESVLASIYDRHIDTETQSLEKFYESIKRRADGISSTGRQALIVELYDKFFRNAFPLMTQKLGIVYTPVEIVDFIIHSIEDVMRDEFGSSLGNEGVHIIDPFSGTGTFISRLLQSGILSKEQIRRKFKTEIHANEIVLLAYYIACINIEAVYEDIVGEDEYQSFDGMVLTDTFQLYEQERDMIAELLPDNSERRTKQRNRDITVVIGNPPYSAGQGSANDNAANVRYANLDNNIGSTYAEDSSANNKNALYDSYIRAFRWASDRIGNEGVIGFVTNAGWIDGNATDGMRKHLQDDFTKIYIFHLRGNQRTSGELSRREGGKVFGAGSRSPIAITILVKGENIKDKGKIYFHDIGDYLDQKLKLANIKNFKSIKGIEAKGKFTRIEPDEDNDWLNHGDKTFSKHIQIGNKKDKGSLSVFKNYSRGLETCRDAWVYNSNSSEIESKVSLLIDTYNEELQSGKIYNEANKNPKMIKWSSSLESQFNRGEKIKFKQEAIRKSIYRPFCHQFVYFNKYLIHRMGQNTQIFPKSDTENLVICVTGIGAGAGFSCLMSDTVPNLHTIDTGQCFPLYLYPEAPKRDPNSPPLIESESTQRISAISDDGYMHFRNIYKGEVFSKEYLFYYIYGILHSPEYRKRFANNFSKELPRIPAVKGFADFNNFSDSGRKLSELHVNFDTVEPYPVTFKEGDLLFAHIEDPQTFYRVKKMKFAKKSDKSSVIYNNNITIQNIPIEAYEYIVNAKPALEWVMDRQCIKTDKDSGIINDANDWANETKNNLKYPLELLQRVITVSIETMKIVKALPKLDID